MNDTVLEVKNLTKEFNSFTAVDNISFSLKEGEILGLLGPNGAGKTTTIQMLLNVLEPTSGEIKYFNKNFKEDREEILQNINFSSTYISLPWQMTVWENLMVFANLYGVSDKAKRINKILDIFESTDLKNQAFYKLSAGQKTRILLVKAFLNYPKVLLLDEPTASLDPDIAQRIRQFLKKEREEFNVSMLFTSHNMDEVEQMCDRVIFLNHGKIIAENKPSDIAKNIEDAKLQLMLSKNIDKAFSFLTEKGFKATLDEPYINITLPEKQISKLFLELSKNNFEYEEVNLKKPDLEDFFLKIVEKNENNKN